MKYFFVVLAVVMLSITTHAQVTFGIQVGGQSANADYQNYQTGKKTISGTSAVVSFKIGGIAIIPVAKKVAFMPELNFVNKGVDYSDTYNPSFPSSTTYKWENNFRTSYVEMPLNLAYNSATFFGGFGPVISVGFGGKATFRESNNGSVLKSWEGSIAYDGQSNDKATDDKQHFKGLEFGGNVFIGYKFTAAIFLKAIYNTSFTDIYPSEAGYTTKYTSSYFGMTVGYLFNKADKGKK